VIERGGLELIGELEPLWEALVAHHHAVAPQRGAQDAPANAWARRRDEYAAWLAQDASFALVARDDAGRAVGYAVIVVQAGSPGSGAPERYADIVSLALAPAARGRGLGRQLLERAAAELAAAGVTELLLDVDAANEGAIRFYEREGFAPMLIRMRRTR
jgi:ribosomal protein S18 acetylase RimI-like enzyme